MLYGQYNKSNIGDSFDRDSLCLLHTTELSILYSNSGGVIRKCGGGQLRYVCYYHCGWGSKYLAYRYLTLPGLNRVFVLCKNSLRRAYTFNSTLKRYYQFVPLHSSDKSWHNWITIFLMLRRFLNTINNRYEKIRS